MEAEVCVEVWEPLDSQFTLKYRLLLCFGSLNIRVLESFYSIEPTIAQTFYDKNWLLYKLTVIFKQVRAVFHKFKI